MPDKHRAHAKRESMPDVAEELLLARADAAARRAFEVIADLDVFGAWRAVGAEAHLVGSLRMGLLMKHRDIDFHVYSRRFSISDSFSAMARLAEHERVLEISYVNLLEADDQCLEWHLCYEDTVGERWQIDLIHILRESPWAFHFEAVADRIKAVLTPETRRAILSIKEGLPEDGDKVLGIEVCQAVLRDGVRGLDAFQAWKRAQPAVTGIIDWMP